MPKVKDNNPKSFSCCKTRLRVYHLYGLKTDNNMPLPNTDDVDDLLNSSDEEEDVIAANVATASVRDACAAGVVPPPPPDNMNSYVLLGQRTQTQDTLIPTQTTQLSNSARRHLIMS